MWLTMPVEASFFGDADHLLDRGDDADVVVAFVANVARVDAAELAGDGRERDHLFGLRDSCPGV